MINCRSIKKLRMLNKKGCVRLGISEIHKIFNKPSIGLNILKDTLSLEDNLTRLQIGVTVGLQAKIAAFINNSRIYFL